jgi:hypothetical protein
MPSVIQGAAVTLNVSMGDKGYTDNYPLGMDLSPNSKLHAKIVSEVNKLADASWAVMSTRHTAWNGIDETLRCYLKTSEVENRVKELDKNKPISIVVPYSYSVLESMLAYLTQRYLTDQLFFFDGHGPEDSIPAKLLEMCCNQQAKRFKAVLDIHTNWRDGFSYGFGAATVVWSRKWGKKPVVTPSPQYSAFGALLGYNNIKSNEDALLFEGNELVTIDPYRFLPDPNTSIHNVQNMDSVGWLEFASLNKLLTEEQEGEVLFNVKYLKDSPYDGKSSKYGADNSNRMDNKGNIDTTNSVKQVCKLNMYVTLVPKDWGIKSADPANSGGSYPEKWLFTLANENLVIRALPLGLNHNMYPVVTIAPDYDGYSVTPISRLEMIAGLQTALNWMFNAHVTNVRKAINDMLIVDPSLINMEDLANPEPGKLIRLRRTAWGKGVDGAVKQLTVNDITRNNMGDASLIMDMMGRTTGATDAMQGRQRQGGERVTAAEFTNTMGSAMSRVDKVGFLTIKQYMQDVAYLFASHTQQFMSQETYVKAVGDWPTTLVEEFEGKGMMYGSKVKADPFNIIADYDIDFKDSATPSADALANDFWTKSFQTIGSSSELSQIFDVARIFMQVARLNGAKNVNEFVRKGGGANFNQMGNQQVAQEAQAGNLIPVNEAPQMGG